MFLTSTSLLYRTTINLGPDTVAVALCPLAQGRTPSILATVGAFPKRARSKNARVSRF